MTYLPEKTIRYKTFVKSGIVDALRQVFSQHVDNDLQQTKITIDFPKTQVQYPAVVVRFFERRIANAGVSHYEMIADAEGNVFKYKHYLFSADIEMAVYTLDALTRDLVADTLVQTISMGDLESYTNRFFTRVYENTDPNVGVSYLAVNADEIQGFGETQTATPWGAEDDLIYQTSYRVGVRGEFYSLPRTALGFITAVESYPYTDRDPVPQGNPLDGTAWDSTLIPPPPFLSE